MGKELKVEQIGCILHGTTGPWMICIYFTAKGNKLQFFSGTHSLSVSDWTDFIYFFPTKSSTNYCLYFGHRGHECH